MFTLRSLRLCGVMYSDSLLLTSVLSPAKQKAGVKSSPALYSTPYKFSALTCTRLIVEIPLRALVCVQEFCSFNQFLLRPLSRVLNGGSLRTKII